LNAPGPDLPPDAAQRAADTIEFIAKLAGSLAVVWAFIAKVGKPFTEWRRKQLTAAIREALATELAAIAKIPERDEEVNAKLMLALERQGQIFDELDLFVMVVAEGRERMDDLSELLDETGFASRERRRNPDRRHAADQALTELQGRLVSRRRREEELRNMEVNRE
jgi:hypothetical protein